MASNNLDWYVNHLQTHLLIDAYKDGYYLVWPDGTKYDGPYKRAQDARRALTMLKRSENVSSSNAQSDS